MSTPTLNQRDILFLSRAGNYNSFVVCEICNKTLSYFDNWEASYEIPKSYSNNNNLRILCQNCNRSRGTYSISRYRKLYYDTIKTAPMEGIEFDTRYQQKICNGRPMCRVGITVKGGRDNAHRNLSLMFIKQQWHNMTDGLIIKPCAVCYGNLHFIIHKPIYFDNKFICVDCYNKLT